MPTPDLRSYDKIIINSSGGKDSQAMLDFVVQRARVLGISMDRLVVVHADLGRVEWTGTAELAERQAEAYGLRFIKVSRPQGDLLDQIRDRGMFPSSAARYCTSDQKRGQVRKVMTQLTREIQAENGGQQVRLLNCMGLRSQESPARAKKESFKFDAPASNGKRHVDEWLPIKDWTTDFVWQRIKASGVESHPAYEWGMPRLSCCFCVLASKAALVRAAQLNPELAWEYALVEEEIGHSFQNGRSMLDIIEEAENTTVTTVEDWSA